MNEEQENAHTIQTLIDTMRSFREEVEGIERVGLVIHARTNRVIRAVMITLGMVAVLLVSMIAYLSSDLGKMVDHMNTMYSKFGVMSDDMDIITESVVSMGHNVEGISTIAGAMNTMNADVGGMENSVRAMKANVLAMQSNVSAISQGTREMAARFHHVNNAVAHMRYNTDQMARPTDIMNPMNMMVPP